MHDFSNGSFANEVNEHIIEMGLEFEHVLVYGVFACPLSDPCMSCDPRIKLALDIAVTEMTEVRERSAQ